MNKFITLTTSFFLSGMLLTNTTLANSYSQTNLSNIPCHYSTSENQNVSCCSAPVVIPLIHIAEVTTNARNNSSISLTDAEKQAQAGFQATCPGDWKYEYGGIRRAHIQDYEILIGFNKSDLQEVRCYCFSGHRTEDEGERVSALTRLYVDIYNGNVYSFNMGAGWIKLDVPPLK